MTELLAQFNDRRTGQYVFCGTLVIERHVTYYSTYYILHTTFEIDYIVCVVVIGFKMQSD